MFSVFIPPDPRSRRLSRSISHPAGERGAAFVLDAMLGVVNLEQSNIIKLFSVMAVVLMPPTLIASIYGMISRSCRNWNGATAIRWHWS